MWNLMLLDIPREKLDLLLELREHYMVYLLSNTNRIHLGSMPASRCSVIVGFPA
mgnify:CR=1 FL=1